MNQGNLPTYSKNWINIVYNFLSSTPIVTALVVKIKIAPTPLFEVLNNQTYEDPSLPAEKYNEHNIQSTGDNATEDAVSKPTSLIYISALEKAIKNDRSLSGKEGTKRGKITV